MTHTFRRRSFAIMWIAVAIVSASAGACGGHTKELQVTPPLPPAEEPPDDVKGVYVGDAGASPQ